MVYWAIMVTEMTMMSVRNLIRSAYQERQLYRISTKLYELISQFPLTADAIMGGSVNFNDVCATACIGS